MLFLGPQGTFPSQVLGYRTYFLIARCYGQDAVTQGGFLCPETYLRPDRVVVSSAGSQIEIAGALSKNAAPFYFFLTDSVVG